MQRGATMGRGRVPRAAVVALLAFVVALLPGVGAADEPTTRGTDRVCPAADVDSITFEDVGEPHELAVTCAATLGLVAGFDDGSYRPGESITREQVASIVRGWIEQAVGIAMPLPEEPRFADAQDSVHQEAIEALAEAGVVSGRSDDTFAPDQTLTRGQFAAVVTNAISYADVLTTGGPLPPDGDLERFDDVEGSTFHEQIAALASIGVTSGVTTDHFVPGDPVTRGQLATFLMRGADYLDEHQRWRPTARTSTVLVAELDPVAADDGQDADGLTDEPDDLRGNATLTVNAFNGTLAYSLDLSRVPGPYADQAATIHLGDVADEQAPVVLELADADDLDDATGGVVTDVVVEADSEVRFADLVDAPQDTFVQVATEGAPGGAVRGQLHPTGD